MLCRHAVTDEDGRPLDDEDESGMRLCTYWSRIFQSRYGDDTDTHEYSAQLRLRITMQHIYSHGQNVVNECADHAAALGAFGLISNQNINTPSFSIPFL